ncbi:MAG: ATP-dependent Clp protease proteolytic subunit [Rhodospirillales bacterium]|nr:ATP-dependent Clp protease proteolytic subunit [Rhodospirillales bacterium]MCB9997213.1 ATP-dependent Clp protease proteolytic subunit [Rhodospirillales bacterium]
MSKTVRGPFNDESANDNPSNMVIPTVIRDNDKGGRVAYDVYSRLLDSNVVFVSHQVEPGMANTIVAQLFHLYYDKIKPALDAATDSNGETDLSKVPEKNRTIKMFINSPGGYVNDGLQIYDAMQLLQSEGVVIETHATGIAMSMGSILLVAGSPGHRYAWPSANIMLHQVSAGTQGTIKDMDISHEESKYINERLKDVYRAHTDMDDEAIEKIFDRDYFMRGEEAVKLGVIDKVKYPDNNPRVKEMLERQNKKHMEDPEVKKTRVLREVPPAPGPAK